MRESDALKTLESEKEKLIGEKHKLKDEVTALRKQADDDSKKLSNERDEMKRKFEAKEEECRKLTIEIEKLKQQVVVTSHLTLAFSFVAVVTSITLCFARSQTKASPFLSFTRHLHNS